MIVTSAEIEAKRASVTALREAYDRAVEDLQKAERAPLIDEPKTGSVIRFELSYSPGGRLYTFAGVSIGDRWYLTGSQSPQTGMTWDELWAWLRKKELYNFKVASRFDTKFQSDLPF